MTFRLGDRVLVYDKAGNYELRGKVAGVSRKSPLLYDVKPDSEFSLASLLRGLEPHQLRHVGRMVLAYDRKIPGEPKYVKDEA